MGATFFVGHPRRINVFPTAKKKSLTCCTTCVADNGKILWLRRLLEEKKKRIHHAPQSSLQKSYRAEQNSSLADRHEHFLPTGKYST